MLSMPAWHARRVVRRGTRRLEGPLGRRKTGSGGGRLAGGKSPAKSNSKNSPLERQPEGFYGKMELNSSLCLVVRLELMA